MKTQPRVSILTCIGCLLILLISACGDDDNYNDDYEDIEPPVIEYSYLEQALAEALGKTPGEEITPDELATLTHLKLPHPRFPASFVEKYFLGWTNIDLLVHCINLKELDFAQHGIDDFSPLARLTRLERLNLSRTLISDFQPLTGLVNLQELDLSGNQLNDLTNLEPLAGLVNLQQLDLSANQVNDLTVLADMVQLKGLYLDDNQIHDIAPLANLIQLKELNLRDNQIRDITPLANLIQINKLNLQDNMIVDLKPLVDNLGLVNENPGHLEEDFGWAGDTVTLSGNPLSDVSINVYIPALQARGVTVR